MNRDDITRMAREAGFVGFDGDNGSLRRFAALVAAHTLANSTAIEQAEKREWVELTDDEARALVNRATFGDRTNWQALVYMVDAKLKETNA
jgi:hypothetical protein